MQPSASSALPIRRTYDHRLRADVHRGGFAPLKLRIPRSTRSTWKARSLRVVVTDEPIDLDAQHLRAIVARQERKLAVLSAVVTLLLAMVRIRGLKLDATRLPTGTSKRAVMHAITRARRTLTLAASLRVLGLSAARYHSWKRADFTCTLDGSRVYISAIIDNFSRMILAWEVTPKLSPLTTCRLLSIAAGHLHGAPSDTTLVSDSGVEKVNAEVDACVHALRIHHVLAQVDVTYSNSMIEAFWRALKHNWLYVSSLDSIEAVRTLVAFFVEQHNNVMPHSAFRGQTPHEIYLGTGNHVPSCSPPQVHKRERND